MDEFQVPAEPDYIGPFFVQMHSTNKNQIDPATKPHQARTNNKHKKSKPSKPRLYKPFSCIYCLRTFHLLDPFQRHVKRHRSKYVHARISPPELKIRTTMYECAYPYCNQSFSLPRDLEIHVKVHNLKTPCRCNYCHKQFVDSNKMRTHVEKHVIDRPYECAYCRMRFSSAISLKCHMPTHVEKKPFKCMYCKQSFEHYQGNEGLSVHINLVHIQKKQYQCGDCKNSYKKLIDLVLHVKESHTSVVNSDNVRLFSQKMERKKLVSLPIKDAQTRSVKNHRDRQILDKAEQKATGPKMMMMTRTRNSAPCLRQIAQVESNSHVSHKSPDQDMTSSQTTREVSDVSTAAKENPELDNKLNTKPYMHQRFKCIKCSMVYKSFYAYSRHICAKGVAGYNNHQCGYCSQWFSMDELTGHMAKHHTSFNVQGWLTFGEVVFKLMIDFNQKTIFSGVKF